MFSVEIVYCLPTDQLLTGFTCVEPWLCAVNMSCPLFLGQSWQKPAGLPSWGPAAREAQRCYYAPSRVITAASTTSPDSEATPETHTLPLLKTQWKLLCWICKFVSLASLKVLGAARLTRHILFSSTEWLVV